MIAEISNNLAAWNNILREKTPEQIIAWALKVSQRPLLSSSFGPYAAAILHAGLQVKNDLKVIWCDTGYNTRHTYVHADELIKRFDVNIDIYTPNVTSAFLDATLGIPTVDDPRHAEFSQKVKLEPFRRALKEHQPDVWFTNLRKGQTAFRDSIDILSISKEGILKVSPFYHWSDAELDVYLKEHNLPNETRYFDPTKVLNNRECGIHI